MTQLDRLERTSGGACPATAEDLEALETYVFAGLVPARAAAVLAEREARAQTIKTYFASLELRHKAELHQLTGRIAERPTTTPQPVFS
jgi:hypothetical protein